MVPCKGCFYYRILKAKILVLKPSVMVFKTIFSNISVICGSSAVLLLKKTRKPRPNLKSLTNLISMLYRLHLAMRWTPYHNFSGIGTDRISSCKSNYHMPTVASFKIGQMWKWIKTTSRIETKLYMVFPLQSWHFLCGLEI